MLELLREHEVAPRFRRLRRVSREIMVAVPFWGTGAIKSLGLRNGQNARVICNLGSGACNPYVIADLMKLKCVKVRTHPRLHAKIYATKEFSIVGSSNASTNGLTLEGEAIKGWIEANVLSDEPAFVQSTVELFETIWDSAETKKISAAVLRQAQSAWDNRPKRAGVGLTAKSLLAACRENPDLFHSVFVAVYDEELGPGGKSCLKKVKQDAVSAPGFAASDFRKAWGYQFEETFAPGSWLVDLDCKKSSNPKVWGCAQVPKPSLRLKVKDEEDLTLAVRGNIQLDGRNFRVSAEDRNALAANATRILGRHGGRLVPLADAVRIIDDGRSRKARLR